MGYLIAAGAGFALGVGRAEVWAAIRRGAAIAWDAARRAASAVRRFIGRRMNRAT